jgi:hypothetical protein
MPHKLAASQIANTPMKLTALIIACTASLLASPARAEVRISFDFFHESLSPYGEWCDTDRYGLVWQPGGVDRDWSPYSDGYWSYTDAGWTWVSYEDFGGITYHYGRWVQLDEVGWCWVPGYEWGPAWVSWRRSDDYVGWAPLPPEARWEVKVGISSWSDTHYDVGPGWYSFCHARDFGAPVLRHVIVPRSRNVTIINVTNNITNITYNHDRGYIFNGGLDYDYIAPRCSHSLPTLKLVQNTTNIYVNGNRGNVFINAQKGNALYVATPPRADSNWNVLTKKPVINRVYNTPTISRGWAGLDKDGIREKLLVKMRDETRGATPESQPARAFKAASIAVVPKKADPTAQRPSLLKTQVTRGYGRASDGPEILKKPVNRPSAGNIATKEEPRIAPAPGNVPGTLKKQIERPTSNHADEPRRAPDAPVVLKKERTEDRRELEQQRPTIIQRPQAPTADEGGLRKKVAEQAEREKELAERAREASAAREKASRDREEQEKRNRDTARERHDEENRRMTVEKQRRASDAAENQRKQLEAQRNSDAIAQQRRAAAEADTARRKQESAQREAADNARRQQAAELLKQRRSADQENARRAAEQDNARRAASDAQRRMQQQQAENSRRAADEARQRQNEAARQQAEAARRQSAIQRPQVQRPPAPQTQPSSSNLKRPLTPEEQEALLKKKRSSR